MSKADDRLQTKEKKCPKCGSIALDRISSSGAAFGAPPTDAEMTHHTCRCTKYGAMFTYLGRW